MATLRELIIKISANSSSFQTEIARASRMGSDYYKTMQNGGRQAAAATRESQRALSELNSQLASVKSTAAGMAGAFAGAFAVNELIGYADTWNQLSGRLKLASTSSDDFATAQRSLMDISQRTGTSIQANTNLYARIAQSMRDAGFASSDVAKVTETVATSLKLSGASTEEASSVITQLSQAIGSGVLRGEEFNAIMENGGRLAKLLAAGLNTTIGGLRNMANNGQLTTDKIIPLLTNVDQLRQEFDTLPASISGSAQKVENSFIAWVGAANNSVGASSALAGVLDGLAKNIDTVADAAGALVAIGAARYFGNMASSVGASTSKLIDNYRSQVSNANAQLYAATQAQRKAVADAGAAASAYNLALAEANVAKGSNASMLATQNLIEKRTAMIAANAALVQSNRAVTASETSLNNLTSFTSRLGVGVSGLLSLVGGIPGLVLLGAGAWYTMYQQQEQAKQSALEYAKSLDDIKTKLAGMSLSGVADSADKLRTALKAQSDQLEDQQEKVNNLRSAIAFYQKQLQNPSPGVNTTDLQSGIDSMMDKLAVEEDRLRQIRADHDKTLAALNQTEQQRIDLVRQQAANDNQLYQSTIMMNGAYSEFNRLMTLGNNLIRQRGQLGPGQYQGPVVSTANATPQQSTAVEKARRDNELASLSGLAKLHQQYVYEAQDLKLTGALYTQYIYNKDQAAAKDAGSAQAKKDETKATEEQNKATREAAAQTEQYNRKMDDLSVAIEVQKVRATEGEKAADLYAASHQAGTKWTDEERKSIQASATELAKWTQAADENVRKQHQQADALKDLSDAGRKYADDAQKITDTRGMSERDKEFFEEQQQIQRLFDKTDGGTKAIAARSAALDELKKKQEALILAASDWQSGISKGLADWEDEASDYATQAAEATKSAMSGMVTNITDMLNGNKASWKDWAATVLKSIETILVNAAIVNGLKSLGSSLSGSGGILGSIGSFLSSASANAKGGAYDSPSLSAYSNSIVASPTYFAFANGAGLMGEAGPEAIMPLTRAPDGSLGVRAVSAIGASGATSAPQVYINIDSSGNTTTQSTDGYQQFGSDVGAFVDQRYRAMRDRDLAQGGAISRAIKGGR
ncbi:phage tail tape measure protein [Martelella alba]|uniref:Phage tail tape measure protein n=1 Tax=Martelella alba TaxID=2590451 RepID=A0ABY2SDT5_9HYPH|nr:phage tail tape measure protein [Martelella alba]TKI02761.1 phage tail tape measure protein [Martelella alba]